MASIVTTGDISPIVGSDIHSTSTDKVIKSGHIADRHVMKRCEVVGEVVERFDGN